MGSLRSKELENGWSLSPILVKNFTGLAPTLVNIVENDPLRDDVATYAKKINEAGSATEMHRIQGAPYIVMQLYGILESGKQYHRVVVRALKAALKIQTTGLLQSI